MIASGGDAWGIAISIGVGGAVLSQRGRAFGEAEVALVDR